MKQELIDRLLSRPLAEILVDRRGDIDEPLDGDEVESLIEDLRVALNVHEGNQNEGTQEGIQGREKPLMLLTDEDLYIAGIDSTEISNDDFDYIAQRMQEYVDESFSPALHDALNDLKLRVNH